MDKKTLSLIGIIMVLLIALVTVLTHKGCNKTPSVDSNGQWAIIKDTIFSDNIRIDTIRIKGKTQWLKPDVVYIDTGKIKTEYRKIFIRGKDSVSLDTVYVPNSWSLEVPDYFKFGYDSLTIAYGFDSSNSSVYLSERYVLNLNKYQYEFFDGKLRNKKLPPTKRKERTFNTSSKFYASYDPFTKTPRLAIDYSILIKNRVGLFSMGYMENYSQRPLGLHLGLVYRLK